MNSLYQIVQIEGKGFGCMALKDIKMQNIWVFFSSRSLKTREKYISFVQFVYFLMEVFYFSILNDKIHNYMCQKKLIVNFIIQKLKSKLTSLKRCTK